MTLDGSCRARSVQPPLGWGPGAVYRGTPQSFVKREEMCDIDAGDPEDSPTMQRGGGGCEQRGGYSRVGQSGVELGGSHRSSSASGRQMHPNWWQRWDPSWGFAPGWAQAAQVGLHPVSPAGPRAPSWTPRVVWGVGAGILEGAQSPKMAGPTLQPSRALAASRHSLSQAPEMRGGHWRDTSPGNEGRAWGQKEQSSQHVGDWCGG